MLRKEVVVLRMQRFIHVIFLFIFMQNMHAQSLSTALEERKEAFLEAAPEEKKDLFEQGIREVAATQITKKAHQPGDKAIIFTLKNSLGKDVSLKDLLEEGPVVLTWYRGGWCPYCNITLHYLQKSLPEIKSAGASLVALTPETPDNSMTTKEKHDLEFEVLTDQSNEIAKAYGVAFELPEYLRPYYEEFKLSKYNGDNSYVLPLAATYIIDSDATIRWAFLDADYRKRAEPSSIVDFLQTMNQPEK